MTIRSSANTAGYRIAATCPGCGAAVEFGADLFVTICDHCRSPLRLVMPAQPPAFFIQPKLSTMEQKFAIDRCCKENGEPLPSSMLARQFLFPYWNVTGVLLKVRNEIERREVVSDIANEEGSDVVETQRRNITLTPFSVTTPAGELFSGVPASIGLRAQYLTLLPLAEDKLPSETEILSVTIAKEAAVAQAKHMSQVLSTIAIPEFGKNSNRFFPLHYSLIFFPYSVYESYQHGLARRFVVDLVSGEVTRAEITEPLSTQSPGEDKASSLTNHAVSLEFHRCPNCGDNLPQEQSFFYLCMNCGQKIAIPNELPPDTSVQYVESNQKNNDTLFPFWLLAGRVVPAFRSGNYEAMFRLASRVTGAIPKLSTQTLEKTTYVLTPVQVSLSEARAIAEADLARREEERNLKTVINSANAEISEASLLFIPFYREQYFYIDSCLKAITFEQAAVTKAGLEPAVKSGV